MCLVDKVDNMVNSNTHNYGFQGWIHVKGPGLDMKQKNNQDATLEFLWKV